jgi:plastocyanin
MQMTAQALLRSAIAGLLVVGLAGCGSDSGSKAVSTVKGATGATVDKIEVKDFRFNPEDTTVKTGATVTWTFSDDTDHNVEPVGVSELKKSPDLSGGKTYTFKFTKAGTISYRCGIHNSMTGTINVTA